MPPLAWPPASLAQISTIQLKLKMSDEVQRLRLKLLPLVALEEEKGKTMSLTMDDLKARGLRAGG